MTMNNWCPGILQDALAIASNICKKSEKTISKWSVREIKIHVFTPNGKREFVPRDQAFPLFFVYCLLLLHKNK